MILGKGGEGTVYKVPQDSSLVAKLYPYEEIMAKRDDEEIEKLKKQGQKLRVMLDNAPDDPTRPDHCSIAWPVDLLLSTDGNDMVIGFLMPRLEKMAPISNYYSAKGRESECPLFRYDQLCRTATNLASAVSALHRRSYIVGDVNESNVLVSDKAIVTLIDTDSFQVRDPKDKRIYRCLVGTDMYTPTELQGENKFSEVDRLPEHDMFGITTLFFQLLMEGTQPFARKMGNSESLSCVELINRGDFPYAENSAFSPPLAAPPFVILPSRLRELFTLCFVDGQANPALRPSAITWYKALQEAERSLRPCHVNNQHFYFGHYLHCPWCERAKLFRSPHRPNWDPFPPIPFANAYAQRSYGSYSAAAVKPVPIPTPIATPPPSWSAQPPPQPVSLFIATPAQITIGQSTTLRWDIPNAHRIEIRDHAGKVIYSGNSSPDRITVYPGRDSVYRLQARGAGISIPLPVHVSVALPLLPDSLGMVVELDHHCSLDEASVHLRSVRRLTEQSIRLYAHLKLNAHLMLAKNTIVLRSYLPLLQPVHPGARPVQPVSGSILTNVVRITRRLWQSIKM